MGVIAGANINDNGLIFSLDAANFRSYSGSGLTSFGLVGGIGGTLVNGVGFTSSNSGIFTFDGSNDYINLPTSNLPYGSSVRTMSIWLKTNLIDLNFGFAVSYGVGTIAQSYFIGRYGSNLAIGTFGYDYNVTTSAQINTWYHIVAAFDGTNIFGYLNGNLQISGPSTANTVNSRFYIGRQTNDSQYWNGSIGQVQLYNRALTAKEIKQNYNATKKRYGL
jgi:hypothetical protein